MPLFLANLAMASYFLALCYVLITAMTVNKYLEVRRVLKRHQHTTWSTVQLLILSVALGSFFRSATFSTLCIFDSQATADLPTGITGSNPWIRGGLPPDFGGEDAGGAARGKADGRAQAELDFYNKVVAVLFNLPDFLFVSSYLLLVLVWAEAFQSLVLYASLFLYDENGIFDDDKQDRLSVLRLQRVGRLVMAWSFGRILYSVMTLLTFTKTQAMLLVVVFFAAELIPIYLTLDKRLLAMLSVENYEPLLETSEVYR
uniref:THH1/TOM1/TOM3 domain-containing protein n=1 Tax=Phytophthora ramorum TaxID=164328 RepID=H3GVI5_PHYRM